MGEVGEREGEEERSAVEEGGHVRLDSTSSLASLSSELFAPRKAGMRPSTTAARAAEFEVPSAFSIESLLRDSKADKERSARLDLQIDRPVPSWSAEHALEDDEYVQEVLEQERRDALVKVWRFYSADCVIDSHPFPLYTLPDWLTDLRDPNLRGPLIKSGFINSAKSLGKIIPEKVLSWLLHELLGVCILLCIEGKKFNESSDKYNAAYVAMSLEHAMAAFLLALSGKHEHSNMLDIDVIDKSELRPVARSPVNAMLFIRLGEPAAPFMSLRGKIAMIQAILQIGLDECLYSELGDEVEKSLQSIFNTIDSCTWNEFCDLLVLELCSNIRAAFLQVRALEVFPVATERDRLIRQFLACSFFFHSDVMDRDAFENKSLLMRDFADEMRRSPFRSRGDVDWADLASRFEILDLAVGAPCHGVQELCEELSSFVSRNPDVILASLDRIRAKDMAQRIRLRLVYSAPELFAFTYSGDL